MNLTHNRRLRLALVIVTGLLAACGQDSDESDAFLFPPGGALIGLEPAAAVIEIPEHTPFQEGPHMALDVPLMTRIGTQYCADTPRKKIDALDFEIQLDASSNFRSEQDRLVVKDPEAGKITILMENP